MESVLVTTGATWTFPELLQKTCSNDFVHYLLDRGYMNLVVQYGTQVPTSLNIFQEAVNKLKANFTLVGPEHSQGKTSDGSRTMNKYSYKVMMENGQSLFIEGIDFDPDFTTKYTYYASLVISHAGTGSILDSLRYGKRLVVMVNQSLADNHQMEIAKEFEQMGYLKYVTGDDSVAKLINLCQELETISPKKMEQTCGNAVESVLLDEIKSI